MTNMQEMRGGLTCRPCKSLMHPYQGSSKEGLDGMQQQEGTRHALDFAQARARAPPACMATRSRYQPVSG